MAVIFLDMGGSAFSFPVGYDHARPEERKPHPKESVWPWSPNYKPPVADFAASTESPKPARPKVTRYNYREVARTFSQDELGRLARLIRRHDAATCDDCLASAGRKGRPTCNYAMEAVSVVALAVETKQDALDYYPTTDWNHNSYAAFGDVL
jgi:hypothetical protein